MSNPPFKHVRKKLIRKYEKSAFLQSRPYRDSGCSDLEFMSDARRVFESEVSQWLSPGGGAAESLCGNRRIRAGIVSPRGVADVQRVLWAASKARGAVRLQPISCGRNWGFGSNLPARDGVYMLDLSGLKKIRAISLTSHCAEVEPGVTQGHLDEALRHEGSTHYFNVTGAGLGASVIGNALERGIGYSGQRHLDLLDLEVVLPGGEVVRTSRFGARSQCTPYLGGLGPDPTGLFCQSNLGVVTAATIALYRRPEAMGGVVCRLADPRLLPELVSTISSLVAEGGCYGVPHIFNRERILTTFIPHLSLAEVRHLRSSTASWTALIPIRGSKAVFGASAQHVATLLGSLGQVQTIDDEKDSKLGSLLRGRPSDFALPGVAFSVFGSAPPFNTPLEATGAGLIHVTPMIPLTGPTVAEVEELTCETLRRHGYEAVPLSVNVLSARTAALIVSIGFDRSSAQRTKEAHRAAEDLLGAYVKAGLLPYRLGLEQGNLVPAMEGSWPKIFRAMRRIFDPGGCMAHSRYEQLWEDCGAEFANSPHRQERKNKKPCTT
jgi:4-cresol dehydrogenase (hydroxylating) flavoprotein subunit